MDALRVSAALAALAFASTATTADGAVTFRAEASPATVVLPGTRQLAFTLVADNDGPPAHALVDLRPAWRYRSASGEFEGALFGRPAPLEVEAATLVSDTTNTSTGQCSLAANHPHGYDATVRRIELVLPSGRSTLTAR